MHISIFMGPFARGPRDDRPLIEFCLAGAERAAADGFSMVTLGEQHFNNYEPYCNPLLMGARLSSVLGDTWFATTIVPLPYHNPIRLAEDINVLDQLMRGKLIVGLSAGRVGAFPDFENFGLDPKQQRAIFADKMSALRRLWDHKQEDGPIRFDGEWVKGGMHGRLMPVPYRAHHPLIAIGSNTDTLVRQAGIDANVLFLGPCPLEDGAAKLALYREGLNEGGHSATTIADRASKSMIHHQFCVAATDDLAWAQIQRMMPGHPLLNLREDSRTFRQMHDDALAGKPGSQVEKANETVVRGWMVAGSPQTVIDAIKAHEAAGFEMVHTRFAFGAYDPPAWEMNYTMFVDEVLPHVDCRPIAALGADEVHLDVAAGPMPVGSHARGPLGISGPATVASARQVAA